MAAHLTIVDVMLVAELSVKANQRLFATTLILLGHTMAMTDGYFIHSFLTISKTVSYSLRRSLRGQMFAVGIALLASVISSIASAVTVLKDNEKLTSIFWLTTHSSSLIVDCWCMFLGCKIIILLESSVLEETRLHIRSQVNVIDIALSTTKHVRRNYK